MLYNLLAPLADDFRVFNLFRYLSFRSGGAMMTALIVTLLIGQPVIRWLKAKQHEGQPIRDDGPESHLLTKKGTPTMGGIMMLASITASTLLWADLDNRYVWVVLGVMLAFGALGAMDDYLKLLRRNTRGVSGKGKLLCQFLVAGAAAAAVSQIAPDHLANRLALPFFKETLVDLGWMYVPFAAVVVVGASNAVNLTDGLDGLATGASVMAALAFALITYLAGNAIFANYLQIHAVPGAGELTVFCAAIVGACLGFLWFNAPPASVFMGDTGSLALGGALGVVSVIVKNELVLVIIGGLFVMEALSVILQVGSYKLRGGKRIFRMAPIHHHFEKLGWSETKVVVRFWIIAAVLALIGLSTLKLR